MVLYGERTVADTLCAARRGPLFFGARLLSSAHLDNHNGLPAYASGLVCRRSEAEKSKRLNFGKRKNRIESIRLKSGRRKRIQKKGVRQTTSKIKRQAHLKRQIPDAPAFFCLRPKMSTDAPCGNCRANLRGKSTKKPRLLR